MGTEDEALSWAWEVARVVVPSHNHVLGLGVSTLWTPALLLAPDRVDTQLRGCGPALQTAITYVSRSVRKEIHAWVQRARHLPSPFPFAPTAVWCRHFITPVAK